MINITNITIDNIVDFVNVTDFGTFNDRTGLHVVYGDYATLANGNVTYNAYYFTADFAHTFVEHRGYDRDGYVITSDDYTLGTDFVAFTRDDVARVIINNGDIR